MSKKVIAFATVSGYNGGSPTMAIPKRVKEKLDLHPGDRIVFIYNENKEIIIEREEIDE
jgi:AbrB family looped-hinge helix DNA binding protein